MWECENRNWKDDWKATLVLTYYKIYQAKMGKTELSYTPQHQLHPCECTLKAHWNVQAC